MDHLRVLLPPFLLIKMFTAIVAIDVFLSLGIRGGIEIFVSLIIDEAKNAKMTHSMVKVQPVCIQNVWVKRGVFEMNTNKSEG